MTGLSDPVAAAPTPSGRTRWLVVVGFALFSFAFIFGMTWAAGFGRDIHAVRLIATAAVLVSAAVLFTWPGLGIGRYGAVAAAAVIGSAAWWFVPSRPDGMNLVDAVTTRDTLKRQLGHPQFNEIPSAKGLKQQIDRLSTDYPSLAADICPELDQWAKGMADAIGEKYRDTPVEKIPAAHDIRGKANRFVAEFPEQRELTDAEFHRFGQRACDALTNVLNDVPLGNWAAFEKTHPDRFRLVRSFPEYKEQLVGAEKIWVAKSAGRITSQAMTEMASNPRQARQACRELNDRLRSLKSLDTDPDRFRGTREGIFTVAMEAARVEVFDLIRQEEYEKAFMVANRHGFEWLATAQKFGLDERASLEELREGTRHLSERLRLAGGPVAAAPEPRELEPAPAPRPQNKCEDDFLDADERTMLEDALVLAGQKKYAFAVAKLAPLAESKSLPAPVLKALPDLIAELRALDSISRFASGDTKDKIPDVLIRQSTQMELLQTIGALLDSPVVAIRSSWNEALALKLLDAVALEFGADAGSRLRIELSAKLFIAGKSKAATAMIKGQSPTTHARQVLADLRTLILGGGTLVNPQVARFVPAKGLDEMTGVQGLVPASRRAEWKQPQLPADTQTTLAKLKSDCHKDARAAAVNEADRLHKKTADTIAQLRKELGK